MLTQHNDCYPQIARFSIHCVVPENFHTPITEGIGYSRGVAGGGGGGWRGSMDQEIPVGRRAEGLD